MRPWSASAPATSALARAFTAELAKRRRSRQPDAHYTACMRATAAIAATASLFILVNSLFGLGGQMLKHGPAMFGGAMAEALPLLVAVVIGGQIGSLMAVRVLPLKWIRWLTAALVLVVGVRLLSGV